MQSIRRTDYFHKVYIRSEFRITTYLIGIVAAYVNLRIKKSKFDFSVVSIKDSYKQTVLIGQHGKLNKYCYYCFQKGRFLGCAASFLTIYICTAIPGYFYLSDVTYNPWHHVLCFTFQRIIYALIISYFLIIGSTSNFGNYKFTMLNI